MKRVLCDQVKMTISLVTIFVVLGCTSDDFWGINEEYNGISYPTMERIARSKAYIDYQKQTLLSMEEMRNIDTTKNVLIGYVEDKPMYGIGAVFSIRGVYDARQKLIDEFPEYEKATDYEHEQIFNLAIMNNRSLLKMAKRIIPDCLLETNTKAIDYESDAVKYTRLFESNCQKLTTEYGGVWLVAGTYYWHTKSTWYEAVFNAIEISRSNEKECGGYYFNDNSGLTHVDPNAKHDEMSFYWYNEGVPESIQPFKDFHIHPSPDNTIPSDSDLVTWSKMPWRKHEIIDLSMHCEVY